MHDAGNEDAARMNVGTTDLAKLHGSQRSKEDPVVAHSQPPPWLTPNQGFHIEVRWYWISNSVVDCRLKPVPLWPRSDSAEIATGAA